MPGDADAAAVFALTPPEEQLLALIRDGRVDAEIAVRLAISNAEVKERVERLATKLGVRDRAGLQDGAVWDETQHHALAATGVAPTALAWPRWWLAAALVAGIAIGVAATWLATNERDAPAAAGPEVADSASKSPTATASPTRVPTPPAPTVVIDGQPMVNLGQVIRTLAGDVKTTSQRESATVVQFDGLAVVRFEGYMREVFNGRTYGEATIGSQLVGIYVYPATERTSLANVEGAEVAYSLDGSALSLLIWVTETRGVAQSTQGLRPYHAVVNARGELLVSLQPIPQSTVLDWRTGEAIDVSSARKMGVVASRVLTTSCADEGRCSVGVAEAAFLAPSNGSLRCNTAGQLEFFEYASGIHLTFTGFNGSKVPTCPPAPKDLIANDPIVGAYFVARATDAGGAPISIAVAGDGTMYAGPFRPKVGCPCVPGN